MACIYRFRLKLVHIHALERLNGLGAEGLPISDASAGCYGALKQMDSWLSDHASQHALAAALRGDETAIDRIRERNRLLYVDLVNQPRFRITELGRELVTIAHHVAAAMVTSREKYLLVAA